MTGPELLLAEDLPMSDKSQARSPYLGMGAAWSLATCLLINSHAIDMRSWKDPVPRFAIRHGREESRPRGSHRWYQPKYASTDGRNQSS